MPKKHESSGHGFDKKIWLQVKTVKETYFYMSQSKFFRQLFVYVILRVYLKQFLG